MTREASRTPHTASAAQHGPTRSCHPLLPLGQKQVSNRLSNLLLLLWITPLGFSILAAKRPERGAAFVVAQPGVCQGDQVGLIEVRMHISGGRWCLLVVVANVEGVIAVGVAEFLLELANGFLCDSAARHLER